MKLLYNMKLLILFLCFFIPKLSHAVIPSDYSPIVIKAPFSFSERVFDLTPAVLQARAEGKNLFIRLGGMDCSPCHAYDHFLYQNVNNLKNDFAQVVVVDIQTWIRGPQIILIIENERVPINEFKRRVGDKNVSIAYPSFWILNGDLRQVRQLPQGNTEFLNVEKHRQFLK